jgi:hypothetical protein
MAFCQRFRKVPPRDRRRQARRGSTASARCTLRVATVVVAPFDFRSLRSFPSVSSLALPCFFGPSLHGRYPASPLLRPLLTSPPLSRKRSPQVRRRIYPLVPSGSTGCVSYDFWASLFPASSPPAPGLTASSCSCGRRFATRFFRLRLTATSCVSLRLPSSAPVGSFHPTSFCPCWAHWGGPPGPRGSPWTRSSFEESGRCEPCQAGQGAGFRPGIRPGGLDSAGINRHGVANERVVQGRNSEPPWPRAMRG